MSETFTLIFLKHHIERRLVNFIQRAHLATGDSLPDMEVWVVALDSQVGSIVPGQDLEGLTEPSIPWCLRSGDPVPPL